MFAYADKIAMRRMGRSFRRMLALGLWLGMLGPLHAAVTNTWLANAGDWTQTTNWSLGLPAAGQIVHITNAGAEVQLTAPTPALKSLVLGGTLVVSNWGTKVVVTNDVYMLSNSVLTTVSIASNTAPSNRVAIQCDNFYLAAGGRIDVVGKGYVGASAVTTNGPGGGVIGTNGAGGASHGGAGGEDADAVGPGPLYGLIYMPMMPGSGGGRSLSAGQGGDGGGVVSIMASNQVVINGLIDAGATNNAGGRGSGGSGGSIYIQCRTIQGTGGVLRAAGGNAANALWSGAGGGGRIAVQYNTNLQAVLPKPALRFFAAGGLIGVERGEIGTVYFPDASLLGNTVNIWGQLAGFNAWAATNLVLTNWFRPAQAGFQLSVDGSLTIDGDLARLDIPTNGVLTVTGDLVLTNGAALHVFSGPTNGGTTYGALVDVGGTVRVASDAWIVPLSDATNGGSPKFVMANLVVATNAGFDASAAGFRGGVSSSGGGPGGGLSNSPDAGGGGYGGGGGRSFSSASVTGAVYGSASAPLAPGSGGGARSSVFAVGGRGGGAVRLKVVEQLVLDGAIIADGGSPTNGNIGSAGGSGGGIYIACDTFVAATTAVLRAVGGNAGAANDGGGGGGRIAVWRAHDYSPLPVATVVTGGMGYAVGKTGTVHWGALPGLGFSYQSLSNDVAQGAASNVLPLALWNTGLDNTNALLTWSVSNTTPWLTLAPAGGVVSNVATNTLTVTCSAVGRAVGAYTGTLHVTASDTNSAHAPASLEAWIGYVMQVKPMPAPDPVNASDGVTSGRVALAWSSVTGAGGYEIWRHTANNTNAMALLTAWSTNAYSDTNAMPGVLYFYWVRAISAVGTGVYSAAESGWRPMHLPGEGLTASDGAHTDRVAVAWPAVNGVSGYQVYRHTANDSNGATRVASTTGTNYDDTAAAPGVLYYYWIRATNALHSLLSEVESGWRGLAVPGGVAATDGAYSNRVALTWQTVEGAAGYDIRRVGGAATVTVSVGAGSVTNVDDFDAARGVVYDYAVRATNALGAGAWSAADSGWRNWAFGWLAIEVTPSNAAWTLTTTAPGYAGRVSGTGALVNAAAPTGTYSVRFETLADYTTPASVSTTVIPNEVTTVTGVYAVLDSDGDRYSDKVERASGSDLLDANSYPKGTVPIQSPVAGQRLRLGKPFTLTWSVAKAVTTSMVFLARGTNTWPAGIVTDDGTQRVATVQVRVLPGMIPATNYHLRIEFTATEWGESDLFALLAPTHGDYDNDGNSDLCLYYPPLGYWIGNRTTKGVWLQQFGWAETEPVPADYDGDGRTDLAVYYPAGGMWYVLTWAGRFHYFTFGWSEVMPFAADFDGDGYDDPAFYYPYKESVGWLYVADRQGSFERVQLGGWDYEPLAGDFDGDGLADPAVYQESSGTWIWLCSAQAYTPRTVTLGGPGMTPVPDDYDGDGVVEPAVYEGATGRWYFYEAYAGASVQQWGAAGAFPVTGDYDGDGAADLGVYYGPLGTWYLWRSADGLWNGAFGWEGVVPLY